MTLWRRICLLLTILTVAAFGTWRGQAFALLGPFQSWMQQTNGVVGPTDIGGPMCISNGYRWNVPVVTYGFDKSFLDFFGTNGEAAVESAIQTLNDLPPASQIAVTNYPFDSTEINYTAEAQGLLDLKSWTLSLLLEHMGLASPTRYTFALRQWNSIFIPPSPNLYSSELDWPDWVYPDYISQLNYDPQTLLPSPVVNNTLYAAYIETVGNQNWMQISSVYPYAQSFDAVADLFDNDSPWGAYYVGLTYDDVGGLCYLLSTNNIAYETLLPDVSGVSTNANSFVNGAWRPGIDKITFVPQLTDPQSGAFLPMTNDYTDTYVTNDIWMQQPLARVTAKPDFLFCAGSASDRTGTTNWINNAPLNGNPGAGGPGVIQPPVKITFERTGPQYASFGSVSTLQPEPDYWGTFDGSTNAPVTYPIPQTGTSQMTIQISFFYVSQGTQKVFSWTPHSLTGTQYALQTSEDLVNWTTLFTVTNNSSVCNCTIDNPSGPGQFFRLQLVNF